MVDKKHRSRKSSRSSKKPKVSVVIPCYNLGRYIDEAVDSVLAQTMQDFEIIIVNDGSTDEFTNRLLVHYQKPKSKVITTENRGVAAARNLAIGQAGGKYICCLDADDLYESTFIEKACKILDKNPKVGFVSCWYRSFGKDAFEVKPKSCKLQDFMVENQASGASMFRKNAWKKIGGYDERLIGYQDWEIWINMLKQGYKCHTIEEFLFCYRIRPDSMIKTSDLPKNRNAIMKMIIEKHEDLFQQNAIDILLWKERNISRLEFYARELLQSKDWFVSRIEKKESHIKELLDAKTWLDNRLHSQELHIKELLDAKAAYIKEINDQRRDIERQQHIINLRDHELSSVYSSKIWKLGCAFRDARHSLRGALLLPFRIIDLGCPNSLKRLIKRLLLMEPHEVIKRNFYKFPYRLLDKLLPAWIKQAIPYQLRNLARAVFRTTNERFYKQRRWEGPLVTVIIPCYNYGRYIEDALTSVLNQSFQNYEIIVVDDGSTDPFTKEKIKKIESRKIPGLRVVHQTNQGVSRTRNNAIQIARGKYISCLDADDLLEPTYFEKCLKAIESENLDICYSYIQAFGDEDWLAETGDFDIETLKIRNCVCTTAVFKKSIWQKTDGYNPNMHVGYEDWEFWISVAEKGGRGRVIPEPLFKYRKHGIARNNDAEIQHNLLYSQIRKNHPKLYRKNKHKRNQIIYRVINPFINIPCESLVHQKKQT